MLNVVLLSRLNTLGCLFTWKYLILNPHFQPSGYYGVTKAYEPQGNNLWASPGYTFSTAGKTFFTNLCICQRNNLFHFQPLVLADGLEDGGLRDVAEHDHFGPEK